MLELKEPEPIKIRNERAVRLALVEVQKANADKLLVAEEVVGAAEDELSPLHSCFVWDDALAGHQYRLSQARALIRHVVVTMPDEKAESQVPKYVSLSKDRKRPRGGYRDVGSVLKSKELLAELEETAKKDLDAVLRRYEMLKGFVSRVRKAAAIATKKK